jgi:hypothetical protein
VGDVAPAAGEVIVDANHLRAGIEQALAEVRTNETRATGDEYPAVFVVSLKRHRYSQVRQLQLAGLIRALRRAGGVVSATANFANTFVRSEV